jgi:hypothetical protein
VKPEKNKNKNILFSSVGLVVGLSNHATAAAAMAVAVAAMAPGGKTNLN